jgi:hypothetical protein
MNRAPWSLLAFASFAEIRSADVDASAVCSSALAAGEPFLLLRDWGDFPVAFAAHHSFFDIEPGAQKAAAVIDFCRQNLADDVKRCSASVTNHVAPFYRAVDEQNASMQLPIGLNPCLQVAFLVDGQTQLLHFDTMDNISELAVSTCTWHRIRSTSCVEGLFTQMLQRISARPECASNHCRGASDKICRVAAFRRARNANRTYRSDRNHAALPPQDKLAATTVIRQQDWSSPFSASSCLWSNLYLVDGTWYAVTENKIADKCHSDDFSLVHISTEQFAQRFKGRNLSKHTRLALLANRSFDAFESPSHAILDLALPLFWAMQQHDVLTPDNLVFLLDDWPAYYAFDDRLRLISRQPPIYGDALEYLCSPLEVCQFQSAIAGMANMQWKDYHKMGKGSPSNGTVQDFGAPKDGSIVAQRFKDFREFSLRNLLGSRPPQLPRPADLLARIHIVQRAHSRRIPNMRQLVGAIKQAIPEAEVTVASFDEMSLVDQLLWTRNASVFVAVEGAGLNNALFLQEHAAVVAISRDPGLDFPVGGRDSTTNPPRVTEFPNRAFLLLVHSNGWFSSIKGLRTPEKSNYVIPPRLLVPAIVDAVAAVREQAATNGNGKMGRRRTNL